MQQKSFIVLVVAVFGILCKPKQSLRSPAQFLGGDKLGAGAVEDVEQHAEGDQQGRRNRDLGARSEMTNCCLYLIS